MIGPLYSEVISFISKDETFINFLIKCPTHKLEFAFSKKILI